MITNLNTNLEAEIDYDVLSSYEDIIPDRNINIDDLLEELVNELEEELHNKGDYEYFDEQDQYLFVSVKHEDAFYDLMKLRINILKSFKNILTSKQLLAIIFHTNFDAEEYIRPSDRKWEIIKEIRQSSELSKFDISNKEELIEILEDINPIVFYELIEILLKYQVIGYCQGIRRFTIEKLSKTLESIKQISPNQPESKNNFI